MFEPFVGIAHTRVKTNGFGEAGGVSALSVNGGTMDTTFTTIGLRASTDVTMEETNFVARGMLGWQHAFADTDPLSTARFGTGNSFAVSGAPIDRNVALIEAGLDFNLSPNAILGIG